MSRARRILGLPVLARIWARPGGAVGLVTVALLLLLALLAPWIARQDPNHVDVLHRFEGPSLRHWMGTDQLGRDFFSRFVLGARIAVGVALSVIALALTIGSALGIAAAFAPRRGERLVLILFDIVAAFPAILFALAVVAILGPGLGNVILIVAVTMVPHFGRVARAQVLALKHRPFLEAERGLGASPARLVLVHVVPNILGPLIVLASMDVPVVITIEAGLSFLGVGVRPPLASWGTLLFDGYDYLDRSSWMALFAGSALALATLGFTLLGEALRDALDPRFQR